MALSRVLIEAIPFSYHDGYTELHIDVRADGQKYCLRKAYGDDFLESEFEFVWRAIGEELKRGIQKERADG